VLRIHLDNLTGKQVSELPISARSQHAFAHVDYAGASYAGDFGYYEAGGHWKSLCAGGSVRTPVETVSEEKDVQFATLAGEPTPPELAPVENTTLQIAATAAIPQRLGAPAPPPSPAPVRAELPPKLTQESPGEGPDLQVPQTALGAQTEPAGPSPTEKKTTMHPGGQATPQFAPARPGEWTLAHELALAQLIGWTARRKEWPGSAEIVELIGRQPELFPVEVAEVGLGGFGPVGISSPMGAEWPQARGFWFNINAELVVYGATEPNAQLTIGGRAVQLRPDGTFSFRFALPDGNYSLPITVYSAQGEVRGAELEFFRGTKYHGEVGQHPQDPVLKVPVAENVS
jgi:hypothetical protein